MANPEHTPTLDGLDRLTVKLYRSGIALSATALLLAGTARLLSQQTPFSLAFLSEAIQPWLTWFDPAIALGAFIAVCNVHIYDKRFRWVFSAITWLGAASLMAAPMFGAAQSFCAHLGLGLIFVTLSAIALKEQLCFKIIGLRLVPLLLAATIFLMFGGQQQPAGVTMILSGAVLLNLAVRKIIMPLHYDIGDKSAYQI